MYFLILIKRLDIFSEAGTYSKTEMIKITAAPILPNTHYSPYLYVNCITTMIHIIYATHQCTIFPTFQATAILSIQSSVTHGKWKGARNHNLFCNRSLHFNDGRLMRACFNKISYSAGNSVWDLITKMPTLALDEF